MTNAAEQRFTSSQRGCRLHGLSHVDPWDCEIHEWRERVVELEAALEDIAEIRTDVLVGVDENMARVRRAARAALLKPSSGRSRA